MPRVPFAFYIALPRALCVCSCVCKGETCVHFSFFISVHRKCEWALHKNKGVLFPFAALLLLYDITSKLSFDNTRVSLSNYFSLSLLIFTPSTFSSWTLHCLSTCEILWGPPAFSHCPLWKLHDVIVRLATQSPVSVMKSNKSVQG